MTHKSVVVPSQSTHDFETYCLFIEVSIRIQNILSFIFDVVEIILNVFAL